MKGHIQQRGKNSFRLKFDAGQDAAGKRKIQFVTFHGTKREAQVKMAELIAVGRAIEIRRTEQGHRCRVGARSALTSGMLPAASQHARRSGTGSLSRTRSRRISGQSRCRS